jgi:hypothetical protein
MKIGLTLSNAGRSFDFRQSHLSGTKQICRGRRKMRSPYLLILVPLALVGCAEEPTTVTTTTTTQEVTTTGPAREVLVTRPPPAVRVETQTAATGPGLCVDNRLLAMDRNRLRLGAGQLGSPAKTSRSLGGRPLGTSSWRLGLDCRPLEVKAS